VSATRGLLAGKVALVTGSSRGIGRAIVLELADHGADVVVNYVRHAEAGRATAAAARGKGVRAIAVRAHAGEADDIGTLFDTVRQEFGGVDILLCNAASGVFRRLLEVDDQAWDWTMNINTRSALRCIQRAVPMMEARGGGRIVTVGSAWTDRTLPLYGMTGLSKGALTALTRYLAVELAASGPRRKGSRQSWPTRTRPRHHRGRAASPVVVERLSCGKPVALLNIEA
jgi:enoyl-[acyl-carrier protein] reductase III